MKIPLLIFIALITKPMKSQTLQEFIDKALFIKDPDKKIEYYTQIIENASDNGILSMAHYQRSSEYQYKRMYVEAIADLDFCIQLQPKWAGAYNSRGQLKYILGHTKFAVFDFDMAIDFEPDWALPYSNRGKCKFDLAFYDEAIKDLNKAIELDPKLDKAIEDKALVEFALREYRSYLEKTKNNPSQNSTKAEFDLKYNISMSQTYVRIGGIKDEWGKSQDAIADFSKAIELDPKNALAFYNRGVVKYALGDLEGAIEDYSNTIFINPNMAACYFNRGAAKYALSDNNGAIKDFTEFIKLNTNYEDAYYYRGMAKSNINDFLGAANDFKKVLELNPNNSDAIERLNQLNVFQSNNKHPPLSGIPPSIDSMTIVDIWRKSSKKSPFDAYIIPDDLSGGAKDWYVLYNEAGYNYFKENSDHLIYFTAFEKIGEPKDIESRKELIKNHQIPEEYNDKTVYIIVSDKKVIEGTGIYNSNNYQQKVILYYEKWNSRRKESFAVYVPEK